MTTYGDIKTIPPSTMQTFSCANGGIIDQITGYSDPKTGALGLQFRCQGGVKSNYKGATTGTPFTINGPFTSLRGTGGNTLTGGGLVSSIGPTAATQTGVIGPKTVSTLTNTCPTGKYIGSVTIAGNGATVTGVSGPVCRSPPIPVAPPVPTPTTYSCPSGKILTKMSAYVTPSGALIGSRFGCEDVWLPWNGLSSGGTAKLASSDVGYATLIGTPMAPYLTSSTQPCPAGSVYTNATVFEGKVTPGGCMKWTPPANPPPPLPVSYAQSTDCSTYVKSYSLVPAAKGVGVQFTCENGKTSPKYGSSSTTTVGGETTDNGFTTMNTTYSTGPWLASLNDVGTKSTISRPFSCPEGQRVSGVTGKWASDGVSSVTFRCSPFPGIPTIITPPDKVPVEIPGTVPAPSPPADTPTNTSAPPLPTDIPSTNQSYYPPTPAPVDDYVLPPMPALPEITTMDLSPLIIIFVVLLLLIFVGLGYFIYQKRSQQNIAP
jgi:hypothetical protein